MHKVLHITGLKLDSVYSATCEMSDKKKLDQMNVHTCVLFAFVVSMYQRKCVNLGGGRLFKHYLLVLGNMYAIHVCTIT